MTTLIQTISHHKPHKGLSHPLSNEKLSHALTEVPQFSDLRLDYHCVEGEVMTDTVGGQKLHGAAATQLEGYRMFLECSWSQEEDWTITIQCVPSARKAAVTQESLKHALPALRDWLTAHRSESWYIGRRLLQFGISEFTDELGMRETHNDRVEKVQEFLHVSAAATG